MAQRKADTQQSRDYFDKSCSLQLAVATFASSRRCLFPALTVPGQHQGRGTTVSERLMLIIKLNVLMERVKLPAEKRKGPHHGAGLLREPAKNYFFFLGAWAGAGAGFAGAAGAAFWNLFRSCAMLWQSPHLVNLLIMLCGCGVPWQSWHFGIILCLAL